MRRTTTRILALFIVALTVALPVTPATQANEISVAEFSFTWEVTSATGCCLSCDWPRVGDLGSEIFSYDLNTTPVVQTELSAVYEIDLAAYPAELHVASIAVSFPGSPVTLEVWDAPTHEHLAFLSATTGGSFPFPVWTGMVLENWTGGALDGTGLPAALDVQEWTQTQINLYWNSYCRATGEVLSVERITNESQLILDLIAIVETLNLENGVAGSLDAKLQSAVKALNDLNGNNDVAAINKLQALINEVEAQAGNKIPQADADALIAAAQAIIDMLGG